MNTVAVLIGIGELIDKYSILQVKSKKITDEAKLAKVEEERKALLPLMSEYVMNTVIGDLYEDLIGVNLQLWEVEDKLRVLEKEKRFDSEFIELARSVYLLNDKRFDLKNKINILTNSEIQEVKQYIDYK